MSARARPKPVEQPQPTTTIRVDDEVKGYIVAKARYNESINSILRRLFKLDRNGERRREYTEAR